jgi:hypothetical protein
MVCGLGTVAPISPVEELSALCSCASVQDIPYGSTIDGARPEEISKQRLIHVEMKIRHAMPRNRTVRCESDCTYNQLLIAGQYWSTAAYESSSSPECASDSRGKSVFDVILSLQAERAMAGRISLDAIVFVGLLNKTCCSQIINRKS